MKQITVAIAGCGSRGLDTYAECQTRFPDKMKIVAVADIRKERLALAQKLYDLKDDQLFDSAEEMLQKGRIADVMFICTPDRMHYTEAMEALKNDYHLLLEKPISPTQQECRDIEKLATEKKRHVVVCHVLRYTVFFQKLKELLENDRIGDVVSVQAIEKVGYWHQAHSFVRGNWKNKEQSSPMILQKCCHDMDILLWLVGKKCKEVSSFGDLRLFKKENMPEGATTYCMDGCKVKDTCPFNAERLYTEQMDKGNFDWPVNVVQTNPTREGVLEALKKGPYGRCVYQCDNNVVDHQVINMNLEGDCTINFTMCAFTAHGGRRIHLMGTKGDIVADMETNTIKVMPFLGEEEEIDVKTLSNDFSGHAGGDARMVEEFLTLVSENGTPSRTLSSVSRSVESHLVALAAEDSRLENGKVMHI